MNFKYEREYFDKLNFDNTANSKFWEYGITKVEIPRHAYKIIFTYKNAVVFAYEKWEKAKQWNIRSLDKIIIYGTWFKLMEKQQIYNFLKNNFELRHNKRIDIALDSNIDIEEIIKWYDFNKIKSHEQIIKRWRLWTKYIWIRDKKTNKRYIIRIYDKKRDILDKNKLYMYKEAFAEEFITRSEVEIRWAYAKNITWESLFDDTTLEWLFKNFFSKYTTMFDFMEEEKISLLHPYNIDDDNFQAFAYDNNLRVNNFIWRWWTLHDMWFDPISILIKEWLLWKAVKEALWEDLVYQINHQEAKMKNLSRQRAYKRKIFPWSIKKWWGK